MQKKQNNKSLAFFYLGIITLVFLFLFQIFLVNSCSTKGNQYNLLFKTNKELTLQNQELKREIISYGSLYSLELKAQELGMTKVELSFYRPLQLARATE